MHACEEGLHVCPHLPPATCSLRVRWTQGHPSTTFTHSLNFLPQAKLKPHSLEPRSQEQPLLQPKQV